MDNPTQIQEKFFQKHKYLLWLSIPALCLLYNPKPFFIIFSPIISRVRKSYSQVRPSLSKIIFTIDEGVTPIDIIKAKIFDTHPRNIITINLFDNSKLKKTNSIVSQSKNNEEGDEIPDKLTDLWAENTVLKIKVLGLEASRMNNENIAVIVKGKGDLLRIVEAKIYNLKVNEYFKIPDFTDLQELHVLERDPKMLSYEHSVIKVPFKPITHV